MKSNSPDKAEKLLGSLILQAHAKIKTLEEYILNGVKGSEINQTRKDIKRVDRENLKALERKYPRWKNHKR